MIVSLDDSAALDVRLSGGKAAALAALITAKFPVPEGFLVTTPDEPDLIARLNALQKSIEPDSLFAVRSSGYAEDSADSSFAGQFETILALKGPVEVSNAVARCFASFSSSRSAAYRESRKASPGGAVIVQRLVEADAAGVAFTLDPLTGTCDFVVIEANFGLGDSVVGGHVNPDGFTVTKKTGEIVQRRIGDKRVRSIVASNGSRLDRLPEHLWREPSLSDEAIRTVADLARRVEEHRGGPVDIEWAWEDGRVWLLQSRPVTTSLE
jgi:phosphoenolpyruvate synthase/pyruvate phosphate dikinase